MIKEAYYREFHRNLEKDIRKETSGDYKKFLVAIVTAARDENKEIDLDLAKKDANNLIMVTVKLLQSSIISQLSF